MKRTSPKRVSSEKKLSVSWVGDDTPEGDQRPDVKKFTGPSRARSYFREYCSNTSLHGLQYLGEAERPLPERLCWLVMICASIVCCMYVIMMQWNKWQNSPVIVTFADRYTPASNIPFPAITICSEVKFKQSMHNHTDLLVRSQYGNLTEDEQKKLTCSSLVCSNVFGIREGNKFADEDFLETFLKFAPEVDDLLKYCVWRSKYIPCSKLFHPIITDDGLCFTFNTITAEQLFTDQSVQKNYSIIGQSQKTKDWSLERGYFFEEDFNDTYPRRTLADGKSAGLVINMEALDHEVDSYCQMPMEGFKMVVHNPAVFPDVSEEFFRVASHRDVMVGVHPEIISTSEELRSYNPKLRQCYFDSERYLRFFNIYTQENCEMECFANFTVNNCGCARFHMPRHPNTPICGTGSIDCIQQTEDSYNYDTKHHNKCKCLPACTELKYEVETTQAQYLWGKFGKEMENVTYGTVTIFLRDMQIITRRRSELYGPSDFVANCGGLLGLFLGFSILSLVEVIYFLTLRLWLKIHRYHTTSNTSGDC